MATVNHTRNPTRRCFLGRENRMDLFILSSRAFHYQDESTRDFCDLDTNARCPEVVVVAVAHVPINISAGGNRRYDNCTGGENASVNSRSTRIREHKPGKRNWMTVPALLLSLQINAKMNSSFVFPSFPPSSSLILLFSRTMDEMKFCAFIARDRSSIDLLGALDTFVSGA